jgi:hypothetical protein
MVVRHLLTATCSYLGVLGSNDNALKLVKQTAKALIRQALIEPQLLADLSDC